MQTILRWVSLSVALSLSGCGESPPPVQPSGTALSMKQFMEWVVDPAADVIWDSVKTVMTLKGTQEIRPETDEQWTAVRKGAEQLVQSGNQLVNEGRARDHKGWMTAARRLVEMSDRALKAAEAKDVEKLFAAGEDIYHSCAACHRQYAPHLDASGNPLRPGANALKAALERALRARADLA